MTVKLNTIENAKEFCKVVSNSEYRDIDIDLVSGRYIIDAKSLLGILSIDLTRPVEVVFHGDDIKKKRFYKKLDKWKFEEIFE